MPDLDSCISNIYADVNFTASTGTITPPVFGGYLLLEGDAGSGRIGIENVITPWSIGTYPYGYALGSAELTRILTVEWQMRGGPCLLTEGTQ